MDLDSALATFGFLGYYIPHINVENDFRSIARENYTVSLNIENGITDIEEMKQNESTGHLEAHLILNLTVTAVSNENSTKKCKVNIVLSGLFDYSGTNKDESYSMLIINGNSTLYSIAIAHIITITALSSTAGHIIPPMLNFVKLFEEMKKEKADQP